MIGQTATGSMSPERVGVQPLTTLLKREQGELEAGPQGEANGSLGQVVGCQPTT